jgi:heme/copper-type cytochrome/quinol oxidase subunit 4
MQPQWAVTPGKQTMPEDGQGDQIILVVLTGLIKFVVVDGSIYVEFNMTHHNGMNFTK